MFLRRLEVMRRLGLKKTAFADLVANDPTFPRPTTYTPGSRAVVYVEEEIRAWEKAVIARRDAALRVAPGKPPEAQDNRKSGEGAIPAARDAMTWELLQSFTKPINAKAIALTRARDTCWAHVLNAVLDVCR